MRFIDCPAADGTDWTRTYSDERSLQLSRNVLRICDTYVELYLNYKTS